MWVICSQSEHSVFVVDSLQSRCSLSCTPHFNVFVKRSATPGASNLFTPKLNLWCKLQSKVIIHNFRSMFLYICCIEQTTSECEFSLFLVWNGGKAISNIYFSNQKLYWYSTHSCEEHPSFNPNHRWGLKVKGTWLDRVFLAHRYMLHFE